MTPNEGRLSKKEFMEEMLRVRFRGEVTASPHLFISYRQIISTKQLTLKK